MQGMRITEFDLSVPLHGVEVIKSVKAHFESSVNTHIETKLWTYGSGNRAKLNIIKRYDTCKAEVTIGFSESLLYCCRLSLDGQRFRLITQNVWRRYFLPNPSTHIINLVDEAFKKYEDNTTLYARIEQEVRRTIEALQKRGISAIPCPTNIYWMRMKIVDTNIDFTVDWNSLSFTIRKIDLPTVTLDVFQDLVRSIALAFGQSVKDGSRAKRMICVDKSHIIAPKIKRKAKYEGVKT